jgi:hypothetical protein
MVRPCFLQFDIPHLVKYRLFLPRPAQPRPEAAPRGIDRLRKKKFRKVRNIRSETVSRPQRCGFLTFFADFSPQLNRDLTVSSATGLLRATTGKGDCRKKGKSAIVFLVDHRDHPLWFLFCPAGE